MRDPKERAFIIKYIDSFNPISPSEKLMNHLETIQVPSTKYITTSMRKKKLTELEFDNISYLAYSCQQCTGALRLMAKVLYFIRWYEELLENGDEEDIAIYEQQFRDDFEAYNIDFDTIFDKTQEEPVTSSSAPEPDTNDASIPVASIPQPVLFKVVRRSENCTNTHCKSKPRFGGKKEVNQDGYCEECFNRQNHQQ